MNKHEQNGWDSLLIAEDSKGYSRRRFLKLAGIFAGAGVVMSTAACKDKETSDGTVDLGSGDFGILNYAYALEQLEAAFYTKVTASFASGLSNDEKTALASIRDHEIAHREFFKNALGTNAIPALEVNFDNINFGDRSSVLGAAKTFEDLGVAAYDGAGQLIADVKYLALAGKIVSVEARHAAIISEFIKVGSFADTDQVTATNGFNITKTPSEVLTAASGYLRTKVSGNNLPKA